MIELITGGLLLASGVMIGLFAYHFAFKMGADTVWRAGDDTRPALFERESEELPLETTKEMDAEALSADEEE